MQHDIHRRHCLYMYAFRGAGKVTKRNAADGPPALWYFQMTGRDWNREGESYHAACQAHKRLCKDSELLRASERARKADASDASDRERAFLHKYESLDPKWMFGVSCGILVVASEQTAG